MSEEVKTAKNEIKFIEDKLTVNPDNANLQNLYAIKIRAYGNAENKVEAILKRISIYEERLNNLVIKGIH